VTLGCSNPEIEEQVMHLRAQLLRLEQEKELMRIQLEEQTAERAKAEKQASWCWAAQSRLRAALGPDPCPPVGSGCA
jgi:hypothetical protein